MIRYDKLEKQLKAQGMNRSDLIRVSGISSRTIAKIGRGEKLSPIVLNKISACLQCRPEDLYEVLPDTPVSAPPAAGAFPSSDTAGLFSKNAAYLIDSDYRVVNFNQVMAAIHPQLKEGDLCYSAIMHESAPCKACPLSIQSNDDLTFFNPHVNKWISIRKAEIQYPGAGLCHLLTCHQDEDIHRNINNRLPIMSGYDVYIEMNLSKNCYRIILPDDPAQEKTFSKDRLDDLIRRTAEHLVHPNDRDAFLEFWDVNTLLSRISGPEHKIHGVFRECRKSGVWDTVYITIVPEQYYGTTDVMIMALYMIMPGHADLSSEETPDEIYVEDRKVNFDYITGLPHRRSYWDLIDHRHLQGGPADRTWCVLASDIEHFHVINNWYGRAAGDSLLSEIGAFLKDLYKTQDVISGYMGGDNFCSIFPYDDAVLEQIVNGITGIVSGFGGESAFRPVFGLCCSSFPGVSAVDAYDRAVVAIRRCKDHLSGNLFRYDEKMNEEQQAEDALLVQFQKGLENHEITFYLQPKCDIRTGKIVGAEALARWCTKERGVIPPSIFIPVLEKAGKIGKLDYTIWENVCRTIADWRAAGLPVLPVSVNVSRKDVFSMDLVDTFTALVERFGLQTSDIEIEFTESAYAENDKIIREVQSGLKTAGFSTMIDDFGSGYSSLNFLKEIDTDAIKLDLRFLELNASNMEKGTNILSSVLSLAEKLNIVTIAEGVETKEQLEFLRYEGCPLAQGYYFYPPMPVPEYEALLADPGKIQEGLPLSSYAPHTEPDAETDIKIFNGYDEKLAGFLKTLMNVAALVRIVDVRHRREFRLDSDGHLMKLDGHCFDIWGRKKECRDCISVIAVETKKTASKYETIGRDRYYVIAKPVRIGGELHALETAIRLT